MFTEPFRRLRSMGWLGLFSTSLVGLCLVGCNPGTNTYEAPPPPEVDVANPVNQSILLFFDENGETEAVEEAIVRARVKGFIEDIDFLPGKRVSADDVLYLIEPESYSATLEAAKASVAAAEAAIDVANAQIEIAKVDSVKTKADLDRQQRLLDNNAGSQADFDVAFAANESAKAAILGAEASLSEAEAAKQIAESQQTLAQLDFDYTQVKAPISGRITKTEVKLGNLVENGQELATIVNREKIFVNFSISDRQLLEFQKEKRKTLQEGEKLEEPDWSTIKIFMRRETDEGFPFEGTLNYIDQSIDVDTGTLGLRAVFDNPDGELLGGMFVTVRVPAEKRIEALLIPELAVGRDQQGLFVLTVNEEDIVEQTRITIIERIGGWAMIESGIADTTRVIVDGLQRALPGSKVAPATVDLDFDEQSILRGMNMPTSQPTADVEAGENAADSNSGQATETDRSTEVD